MLCPLTKLLRFLKECRIVVSTQGETEGDQHPLLPAIQPGKERCAIQWGVEGRRYAEVDEVFSLPVSDEDVKTRASTPSTMCDRKRCSAPLEGHFGRKSNASLAMRETSCRSRALLIQPFLELAFLLLKRFPKRKRMRDSIECLSCSPCSDDGDGPIS